MTINHKGLEYKTVKSPITGKIWLDRNLGASKVATACDGDEESYGDYYQWGRDSDGHEKINCKVTGILSLTIKPNHDKFIIPDNDDDYNFDWLEDKDDGLWKNGKNCPCPPGFRVPTMKEILAEKIEETSSAFDSFLKLPSAGSINGWHGYFCDLGSIWSSSVEGDYVIYLSFHSNGYSYEYSDIRTYGRNIRCIKD